MCVVKWMKGWKSLNECKVGAEMLWDLVEWWKESRIGQLGVGREGEQEFTGRIWHQGRVGAGQKKASRPKRRTPRSLTLTNIQKGSNQLTKNHIDSGVWSDGFRLLKCAHTHTHTPTTTTTTTSWQKNKTLSKDKQKCFHTLCAAAPTKLNNWKKPRAVRNGWRSCSKTHEHHSRQVGERELLGCGRLSWLASPVNPVDSWRISNVATLVQWLHTSTSRSSHEIVNPFE